MHRTDMLYLKPWGRDFGLSEVSDRVESLQRPRSSRGQEAIQDADSRFVAKLLRRAARRREATPQGTFKEMSAYLQDERSI